MCIRDRVYGKGRQVRKSNHVDMLLLYTLDDLYGSGTLYISVVLDHCCGARGSLYVAAI